MAVNASEIEPTEILIFCIRDKIGWGENLI